ncbi:hypothetical protein F511_02323 [Dorcoceras hygrometricum]|uniref:Gibberellin-regulated protein 14 n=1 Tax=Dorcoceras hygrometricum TaxID=472368 RepID=A0A2Z7CG93_9LAMI|nr:hypothetical protein F511_02323 [Dorcoceras hygrometricum]
MTSKAVLLALACFLLIDTRASLIYNSAPPSPATSPLVSAPPPPSPVTNAPTRPPLAPNAPPPPSPTPTTPPPPSPSAPTSPPPTYVKPPRTRQECIPLCVVRCKKHSRKNVCMRACLTCCERCKCVPPGQYGNKEKCGKCYANMTTKGGKLKCP